MAGTAIIDICMHRRMPYLLVMGSVYSKPIPFSYVLLEGTASYLDGHWVNILAYFAPLTGFVLMSKL